MWPASPRRQSAGHPEVTEGSFTAQYVSVGWRRQHATYGGTVQEIDEISNHSDTPHFADIGAARASRRAVLVITRKNGGIIGS